MEEEDKGQKITVSFNEQHKLNIRDKKKNTVCHIPEVTGNSKG